MNLSEVYSDSIKATLKRSEDVLLRKREEYAPEVDPLSNFKEGAEMSGQTPEQVLFMYCLKHLVSVRDIIFNKVPSNKELIREKTGDIINYMVLLNALQDEKEAVERENLLVCIEEDVKDDTQSYGNVEE